MNIILPELSLVVLVGASGSGKSTFAARHFLPTEIISSDRCRALVSDDENSMDATHDAFDLLRFIAAKRLKAGKLTVIDATNVKPEDRAQLVELAREYHCLPTAIVLDLPEQLCRERNAARPNRQLAPHVVRNHAAALRRSRHNLKHEGFRHVYRLQSAEEIDEAEVARQPLWNNKKTEHGPFDIIGDIHGCLGELLQLLEKLGYNAGDGAMRHAAGRKAIFLGDLVDRGPDTPGVLKLVMAMCAAGTAYCVPGNHDIKLMRKLRGKSAALTHGLAESMLQLEAEPPEFAARAADFIDGLISHLALDGGRLVVAHAGMPEHMQGRGSGRVREFALYGETTGETDEFGLPVRINWAADYRGAATVVYGHTPVPEAQWLNRTINIDTGCVFGGRLTALQWPEKELIDIPAARTYCEPARPLVPPAPALSAQQAHDDLLDYEDVAGKRLIQTRLDGMVKILEANAPAALEAMSRFAVDPRWLIYLPPTMSPCETSAREGLLEHPDEAFAYYRRAGVETVVCEEKHMGSRAVVVVCRDEETARRRFGETGGGGIIYSRTGRRFFDDLALEERLLDRIRAAAAKSWLWEKLNSDWLLLDCELMPWSAKARELLDRQYAPVGAAAHGALAAELAVLEQAAASGVEVAALLKATKARAECASRYDAAWRRYCWPTDDIAGLRLAPFHLLASEGAVHADKNHHWHMEILAGLCAHDELLLSTPFKTVHLNDEANCADAEAWWQELTGPGGEGMVVKPLDFIARDGRRLLQPAVKCRGREYLRIIYGPEYTLPENLTRLRERGVGRKRSLALREFALGIEALERFVAREPLRRVHECVFGVLALESEPVDPRL